MSSSTNPFPFKHPDALEEVKAMIELGTTESIHLDYKTSAALMSDTPGEISKDTLPSRTRTVA